MYIPSPPVGLPPPGADCVLALAELVGDVESAAVMWPGPDVLCREWAVAGTWVSSIAERRAMWSGYVKPQIPVGGKNSLVQVSPSAWDIPARVFPRVLGIPALASPWA